MKKIVFAFILFSFVQTVLGQEKPLSQAEYVRMLYSLEKAPAKKDEVLDALRGRGIAFVLTDGLRGLTRTKSSNNDDIKRALEEAERRRQNPGGTKLPSEKDASTVLEQARLNTLASLEEMPDFVVKQQVQRAYAYAGTGRYLGADNLVLAVSYSTAKGEENKVLTVNGVPPQDPKPNPFASGVGGYTSIGEFVGFLSGVFRAESDTKFRLIETDTLRERKCLVWEYEIAATKATYRIASGATTTVISAGYRGKIWVDRETFRVIRLAMEATEIPSDYPVRKVNRTIDYDWVTINNEKYLLPILADVSLISREQAILVESRNKSSFRNYQKYGTDVVILDEDLKTEPEPEVKKPD